MCHIPKTSNLHIHYHDNLKSYTLLQAAYGSNEERQRSIWGSVDLIASISVKPFFKNQNL
jgi:predicted Zn-dependent peptidase